MKNTDNKQFSTSPGDNIIIIYCYDIMLSLCRTIDEERYSTALAVAKRYNVPLFDVLFCHLKWLLTKSE